MAGIFNRTTPAEWNGLAAGAAKQPNGFRCNEETFRSEILHRTGEDGISW